MLKHQLQFFKLPARALLLVVPAMLVTVLGTLFITNKAEELLAEQQSLQNATLAAQQANIRLRDALQQGVAQIQLAVLAQEEKIPSQAHVLLHEQAGQSVGALSELTLHITHAPLVALIQETEMLYFELTDLSNNYQNFYWQQQSEDFLRQLLNLNRRLIQYNHDIATLLNTRQEQSFQQILAGQQAIKRSVVITLLAVLVFFSCSLWLLNQFYLVHMVPIQKAIQELSEGQIPSFSIYTQHAFPNFSQTLLGHIEKVRHLLGFISNLGQEAGSKQAVPFPPCSDMGKGLTQLQHLLSEIRQQDQARLWQAEGLTKVSAALRNKRTALNLLCEQLLVVFADYTNACMGCIYLYDDTKKVLVLKALYANGNRKQHSQELMPGEGMIGQVFLDRSTTFITEIPHNYTEALTLLGAETPSSILAVPLLYQQQCAGVIELASTDFFTADTIAFMEKAAELLAADITNIQANEKTKELLAMAQDTTQRLNASEEELRENLAALRKAQQDSQLKQQQMEENQRMLEQKNDEIAEIRKQEKNRAEAQIEAQQQLISKNTERFTSRIQELQEIIGRKNEEIIALKNQLSQNAVAENLKP
jgi:GAF domain-containing protein